MEENAMVKVLVWDSENGTDAGFYAEFGGEELSSYVDNGIVYTLYKCNEHGFAAYRVHIFDETVPSKPKYKLYPYKGDSKDPQSYKEPYREDTIAKEFPRFLLDLKEFPVHKVGAEPLRAGR
jgi:hypothetical protein